MLYVDPDILHRNRVKRTLQLSGCEVQLAGDTVAAAEVAGEAARTLGVGTARNPELVTGGGPKVENIEAALGQVLKKATEAVAGAGAGG